MDFRIDDLAAGRTYVLTGRMTFHDNDSFLKILGGLSSSAGQRVALDMAGLDYIDSFGIGLLLQARDQARSNNVALSMRVPAGPVRSILEQMDLAGQLPVEPPLLPLAVHHAQATVTGPGGLSLTSLPRERGPGLALSGRFTFADQGAFLGVLQKMERLDGGQYRLDLSAVSFMDSGGLSMLMMANDQARHVGGKVVLVNPSPRVRDLLRMAAVDTVMPIEG
jgi:anti-anti-sigma factor